MNRLFAITLNFMLIGLICFKTEALICYHCWYSKKKCPFPFNNTGVEICASRPNVSEPACMVSL